jgi:hypothetical protein
MSTRSPRCPIVVCALLVIAASTTLSGQSPATIPAGAPAQSNWHGPFLRPLHISSLDNYFSVVGEFHGKLFVFDDLVVVKLDSLVATRVLPNDPQGVRLDSIRVGIGVGDNQRWSPMDDSKAIAIGRAMVRGDRIVHRNVRFALDHAWREGDADSWVVVTFHITTRRPGEKAFTQEAFTYAHSVKGVLAVPR